MRTLSKAIGGGAAVILALALGGCGKVEPKQAPDAVKPRAEAKRHRAACASSTAYDRLKGIVFDRAVSQRQGDRTNLDILADYSIVRIEDPVVNGWDPALDRTQCSGRFILQVPAGAERAFGGERSLTADIDYTAQAAADGSGYVYRLTGAEPIIGRLAAFNLSTGAYRPSPAIDPGQQDASVSDDAAPVPVAERLAEPTDERATDARSTEPRSVVPAGDAGEATVRRFYAALGEGNGRAASAQVVPEKRASGAFAPDAMARFYGRLAEPIRLTRVVPLDAGRYRVSYRYSAGRSRCEGSAVIRLADRDGRAFIRSIDALNGC
ncbi:hypothetical protein ACFSGX_17525 [Sphingomonas arantia]|uniref:Lipoprotein n=1 Tax=Sphingomonas arantia TaxID=1460676 RepID=A0ABW4U3X4_9SPHN